MASKYKTIKGKRYDRSLIEKAEELQASKKGGSLGQNEVKALWQLAQDGQKVTETEKQTLDYIVNNYTVSAKARQWLQEQIQGLAQENATEAEGKSPQGKARGKQSSQQRGKTTGQAPKTPKTSGEKTPQSVDQPSGAEPPPSQGQQSQTREEQQPSSPPPEEPSRESMSEQPSVQPSTDQPAKSQDNKNSWLKWLVAAAIVVAIVFVFWPKSSSEDADQIHHQAKHQPKGTAPKDKSRQNKTDKKTDKKPATKKQEEQKAKAESKDSTKQQKPQEKKTTPKTTKAPTKAKTDSGHKKQNTITVQKGDTLREIAQREYGDADAWQKIHQANSSKIKDPNKIFAGQSLVIPAQ